MSQIAMLRKAKSALQAWFAHNSESIIQKLRNREGLAAIIPQYGADTEDLPAPELNFCRISASAVPGPNAGQSRKGPPEIASVDRRSEET